MHCILHELSVQHHPLTVLSAHRVYVFCVILDHYFGEVHSSNFKQIFLTSVKVYNNETAHTSLSDKCAGTGV